MSKINIHRSTFLEKEELNRMIGFSAERTVMEAILSVSTSFGLVSPKGVPGTPFTMVKSSAVGGVDIKGGYIITSGLTAFFIKDTVNFNSVPADGQTYYIKAVCETRAYEPGYVQVDTAGNISGTVDFSNLIRGQSSGVPTCVRFVKDDGSEPRNNSVYQVVDIINPNNIVLSSGYQFVSEQQLRVIILGSLPMGRRFTDEQLEGLYIYNVINYKFEKVSDFTERAENEFYIGRVRKDISGIVIDVLDERYSTELCPYWKGLGGGVSETYFFTITPTPADATVMMNSRETSTVRGENGLVVEWTVSKPGYFAQSGTHTINGSNTTLPVNLVINPNPEKSTITVKTQSGDISKGSIGINNPDANLATQSLEVISGETVNLYAKPVGVNQFLGWYLGTELLSTQNPYKYPVNATVEVTAVFDEYWDFEVVSPTGGTEAFGVSPIDGSQTPEQFLVRFQSQNIPVTGIALKETSVPLFVGDKFLLTAIISPSNSTNKQVIWWSLDPLIASCIEGEITAIKKGGTKAVVRSADGGFTATCSVWVDSVEKTDPVLISSPKGVSKMSALYVSDGNYWNVVCERIGNWRFFNAFVKKSVSDPGYEINDSSFHVDGQELYWVEANYLEDDGMTLKIVQPDYGKIENTGGDRVGETAILVCTLNNPVDTFVRYIVKDRNGVIVATFASMRINYKIIEGENWISAEITKG